MGCIAYLPESIGKPAATHLRPSSISSDIHAREASGPLLAFNVFSPTENG